MNAPTRLPEGAVEWISRSGLGRSHDTAVRYREAIIAASDTELMAVIAMTSLAGAESHEVVGRILLAEARHERRTTGVATRVHDLVYLLNRRIRGLVSGNTPIRLDPREVQQVFDVRVALVPLAETVASERHTEPADTPPVTPTPAPQVVHDATAPSAAERRPALWWDEVTRDTSWPEVCALAREVAVLGAEGARADVVVAGQWAVHIDRREAGECECTCGETLCIHTRAAVMAISGATRGQLIPVPRA